LRRKCTEKSNPNVQRRFPVLIVHHAGHLSIFYFYFLFFIFYFLFFIFYFLFFIFYFLFFIFYFLFFFIW